MELKPHYSKYKIMNDQKKVPSSTGNNYRPWVLPRRKCVCFSYFNYSMDEMVRTADYYSGSEIPSSEEHSLKGSWNWHQLGWTGKSSFVPTNSNLDIVKSKLLKNIHSLKRDFSYKQETECRCSVNCLHIYQPILISVNKSIVKFFIWIVEHKGSVTRE